METKNTESPIIRRELGPLSYNVKNIGYEIDRAFDELTGPNGEGLEDFILDFLPTGRIKKVDKLGKQVLKLIKGGGKPGTAEVLMKRGELTNVQGVLDTFDKAIRNIQLSKALTSRKANIKHDKAAQEDWFMKAYYTFKDYADKYDEVIDPKIFTNRVVSIAKELQIKPIKGMDLTFKDSIKGLIPLNMTDPFYGSDDNIFNSDVLATRAVARDIYNKSQSNKYVTTEALLRSYGDPGKLAKQIAVFTGINALGNKTGASSILPVHNPTKLAIITSGLINALTDTATYNEVYRKMFTNPRSAHDIGYWGSKKLVNQPTAEKLPDVPLTEYFPPQIKEITDGYLQEGNLVNQTIKRTKFVQEPEAPKEQPNPDIIKEFINQIRR
tara:strand:- start:426 stop:1574 length:1149 start_codon:yes stop_codon:yes gene_type:complete